MIANAVVSLTEDKKAIQIVSALVLQLIQSCTQMVRKAPKSQIDMEVDFKDDDSQALNSYESAVSCAKAFIVSFMNR
jgi:hypothetical protein